MWLALIKKLDANVKSSENYINRRKDAMQGFKPTEVGPNTSSVQTPPLSKGKGEKFDRYLLPGEKFQDMILLYKFQKKHLTKNDFIINSIIQS